MSLRVEPAPTRWLRNVALYAAVIAGATLSLGAIAAISDGGVGDAGEAFATWILATVLLGIAGLFALVPYLVLVELFLRTGRRRRLAAIVLGAVIAGGGLILSQLGQLTLTWSSVTAPLGASVLGAIYGAIVRLPAERAATDEGG